LPDKWGRYKTMRLFGLLHLVAQFGIIFIPNYYARLIGYGLMGAA